MELSNLEDEFREKKKKTKSSTPHRNKSIDVIRERRNRKKAKQEAARLKMVDEEGEGTDPFATPTPKTPDELRAEIDESKKKLKELNEKQKKDLAELKRKEKDGKKEWDETFGAKIDGNRKEMQRKENYHNQIHGGAQKIMNKLREENQGLRATATKFPKQNKELKRSNNVIGRTTEQILMQIEVFKEFCDKLKHDQDKLQISSNIIRDEYIPFYRNEKFEKQEQVDLENKIRHLYRDAMLKVCKRIVNTREVDLIEDVSLKILEVEGEFNPSFDPAVLFVREDGESARKKSNSDSDSDSSSDDDSSSSSSSSDSDSDSDDDKDDDKEDDKEDDDDKVEDKPAETKPAETKPAETESATEEKENDDDSSAYESNSVSDDV